MYMKVYSLFCVILSSLFLNEFFERLRISFIQIMSTVCKEQTSTCKCIVKEKIIDGGDKSEDSKKEMDCSEKYKQLGDCLNECLMQKCRERKNKASKKDDAAC